MAPHYVTNAGVFSTVTGLEFRVPMQKLLLQGPEKSTLIFKKPAPVVFLAPNGGYELGCG